MKTNCIYHISQQITNFCRDIKEHCLMPLCPQCISEHSQYHDDQRTRPQYTTLNQILADVHVQIGNCIQLLSQDKARNAHVIVNIQQVADLVKQKINAVKEMVYQALEESFLLLEKDVNKTLEKIHETKGVYCIDKSQKQDRLLLEQLDELQYLNTNLKGERGLSNIIYFMRQKQAQIESFHSQFSAYLHTNENYEPKIQINGESLYSLDAVISRILKVGQKSMSSRKKHHEIPIIDENKSKNNRTTPLKTLTPQNIQNTATLTANRLQQKGFVPFAESEIRSYSPHIPKQRYLRTNIDRSHNKGEGQYEKLSKKVAIMRQENDRLSRVLAKN